MLLKVKLTLAALAVAGAAWAGWWVQSSIAENKRLSEAVRALSVELALAQKLRRVDAEVAKVHTKEVARLTTLTKAQDAKLKKALADNAPWRDSVVPSGVLDALRVSDSAD